MDGNTKQPKYVVTLLRDRKPIAVLEIQQVGDNAATCEGFYKDIETLKETREVLLGVSHSVGYLIWKETGVLPSPPGHLDTDEITELPF